MSISNTSCECIPLEYVLEEVDIDNKNDETVQYSNCYFNSWNFRVVFMLGYLDIVSSTSHLMLKGDIVS